MKERRGLRIQGWDVSIGHGAGIEFTDGTLSGQWTASDKPIVKKAKKLSTVKDILQVPQAPKRDKDVSAFHAHRLDWWYTFFENHVKSTRPCYVALEDYAYGAGYQAHQIGEVGGAARRVLWKYGIPFRLHDPMTIKMFACENGHANKEDMKMGVKNRWGIEFYSSYPEKCIAICAEDLTDAFAVVKLLHLEIQLRKGLIRLQDLSPKDIQIFNRATKTYPVNILGRNFIVKAKTDATNSDL